MATRASKTTEPAEPATPDAAERAVTDDPPEVPVHIAWARVMREVGIIGKHQRNTKQNFNFRGVDAVVNVVGPILRRHGVFIAPTGISNVRVERYSTSGGTAMAGVMATIKWTVWGPMGDTLEFESIGESSDAGDKATPKAHSVAYRTVLLQSLCIPTDEPDPDADAHERSRSDEHANSGEQTGRPADPRQKGWDLIAAKGAAAHMTIQEIAEDFKGRMGKPIDGPDTKLEDLKLYYDHMRTPPSADAPPAPDEAPEPTESDPAS